MADLNRQEPSLKADLRREEPSSTCNVDLLQIQDWSRLVNNSNFERFESERRDLYGIAIHNNEVYMTCSRIHHILVYNLQDLSTVSGRISVKGLNSARRLVYNESDSCLYTCNLSPGHIYKISTLDSTVTGWATQTCNPWGLSISKQKNLLVSYMSSGQIDEFNGSGQRIRSIKLADGITGLYHSIEMETGEFIVCQRSPLHRICLVDSLGKVIKSCGKESGSDAAQLGFAHYVELDQRGSMLVADHNHSKLRVLTSEFKYVADVNITDTQFHWPTATCWDKDNDRLLVLTLYGGFYVVTPQTL